MKYSRFTQQFVFSQVNMQSCFCFGKATPNDADAIVEINNSYLNLSSQSGFLITKFELGQVENRIIKNPERFFVCKTKDNVVGFVEISNSLPQELIENPRENLRWLEPKLRSLFESESTVYIEKIAVKKSCQRQKIGRELYQSLFQEYPEAVLYAFVVLKPVMNSSSLAFHSRMGFLKAAIFQTTEFCGLKNYESALLLKHSSSRLIDPD